MLVAAAAVLASSCKKEKDVPVGSPCDLTYQASFAQEGAAWEAGDMFSLLDGTGNYGFRTDGTGPRAEFSGTALKFPEGQSLVAVTPYSADYALDGRNVTVTLPSSVTAYQTGVNGGVAVGVPQGNEIVFRHANAFLQLEVTRRDVVALVLSGGNGESLAGTYRVNVSASGTGTMTLSGSGVSSLAVVGELTPGKYLIPVPPQGYNGFKVTVKTGTGIGECRIDSYPKLTPGAVYSIGKIDEEVEWIQTAVPQVELHSASSSTVAVTWSVSGFADVAADITENWSVGIYNDAACSDLRVSWNIPSEAWTALNGNTAASIGGPYSPRFGFSGLPQGTDFWVKVWYTDRPEYESKPFKVSTLTYTNKSLPETSASEGDILLSEDFGELVWGGDIAGRSYGYSDENRSSATALDSAAGDNPVGEQTIGGVTHKFYLVNPLIEMGLFNTLKAAVPSTRLAGWTSMSEDDADGRALARQGYVKLGASSKTGAIVTPPLGCLESKAVITVSFKAHPYKENSVDPLEGSVFAVTTAEEGVSVLKSYDMGNKVDFAIDGGEAWKDYSYDVIVRPGDRIAISTRRSGGTGQCRFLVDEVSLTLKQYLYDTKVYSIATAEDLQNFLSASSEYAEEDDPVVFAADIDLQGVTLVPGTSFAGTLDGAGHCIKNWASEGTGLLLTNTGLIKDLTLDSSCTVALQTGKHGLFTDANRGTITGCHSHAVVTRTDAIDAQIVWGAIAGENTGTISDCSNKGNLTISVPSSAGNHYIGGVLGYFNTGERVGLKNCVNDGDITFTVSGTQSSSLVNLGGVTPGTTCGIPSEAKWRGIVEDCTNNGDVAYTFVNTAASKFANIGGVAAYMEGALKGCVNTGKVSLNCSMDEDNYKAQAPAVGGVAGWACYGLEDCINRGEIVVEGTFGGGTDDKQGTGAYSVPSFGGVAAQAGPHTASDEVKVRGCVNEGTVTVTAPMYKANSTSIYTGGIVGYAKCAMEGGSNASSGAVKVKSKARYSYTGGAAGAVVGTISGVKNAGAVENDLWIATNDSPENQSAQGTAAGIVAYANGAVRECENLSGSTLTVRNGHNNSVQYIGGIAGYKTAATPVDACINRADISLDFTTRVKQFNFGGIFGQSGNGACISTGDKNYGKLTVTQAEDDPLYYYYIGGICGTGATSQQYSSCENYGDISYEGPAKIRIGGIAAYTNSRCDGSKVECDIKAVCTGTNYSEVGGVVAYTALVPLDNWSFKGNISTEGSTAKVYTGGLLGKSNGKSAFNGCTFDGTLTGADGNNVPGLYVGGLHGDNLAMTFGASSKCVVRSGSKINGVEVTELTLENLVSQSSDESNGYTSTATLTDIVLE